MTTTTDLTAVSPVHSSASEGLGLVPATWDASWRLAQRIAGTAFVPAALRGKPESVLAAVLFGAELQLGPMQALASIHVIDGRPAAAPELMRALIARAGHRIDVVESTDDHVTLHGVRADTGAKAVVTWSMQDAQRAALTGKGAWKTYPRAMLLARATGELARMLFPDVIAGLSYTPEEVASIAGHTWVRADQQFSSAAEDTETISSVANELIEDAELVPDPAVVTFERLLTLAGTTAAEELRELAELNVRKLSASEFRTYPQWRELVEARLAELLEGEPG